VASAAVSQLAMEIDTERREAAVPALSSLTALGSVCLAICGEHGISDRERNAAAALHSSSQSSDVHEVVEAIRSGCDPLGSAYCSLMSARDRRTMGQTFTPDRIVSEMFQLANTGSAPYDRIVDPGAGTGRFVLEGLRRYPRACGIAIEADPIVALALRANGVALGLSDRLVIHCTDYRDSALPPIPGRTLFIGNPPYVRHHDISPERKQWYTARLRALGRPASQLAGLHLYFFLKTLDLARPGDVGCFITAAEWLDVNYGQTLRELLTNELGATEVLLLAPECRVFSDALVSACITKFEPGTATDLRLGQFDLTGSTMRPKPRLVTRAEAAAETRWSPLFRHGAHSAGDGAITIGSLFRVSRGQVTGKNRVWVTRDNPFGIPDRFVLPAVTRAEDITRAPHRRIEDVTMLCRVIDLPASLDSLDAAGRDSVERFLAWAKIQGADLGYIARHRRPWWRVALHAAPPIVVTYMGRRPPVFALNPAGARLINVAHGLYPRQPMVPGVLECLVDWLNRNVTRESGRVYSEGLTKFEPSEVMAIRIPDLGALEAINESAG